MAVVLEDRLRQRFGLSAFHPWQRDAIQELLSGRQRVLAVAPTGGGKSLCYQFPATELEGTTIVVSPLIALMEDQVRSLGARGIPATYLASTLDMDERRARQEGLREGRFRLVYVAPERLATPSLVAELARLRPPLVAIDEAHCISQWGHDFRPDYLRLGEVLQRLGAPRVLACTATATPAVRAEILERLGLPPAQTAVIVRGFARPNLHLSAFEAESAPHRRNLLMARLREALGSAERPQGGAIIYAGTRRNAEELTSFVTEHGFLAATYHAGLESDVRTEVGRRFSERDLDVVVATNAFGMGIDRPDIRIVIHAQAPGSIEAYYQEVGRAGRDGKPAAGVLLSSTSDIGLRRRLIEGGEGPTARALADRQWRLFCELLRYVEAGSCRHDFILRYFEDEQETLGGCGHCDVCERLESLGSDPTERAVTEKEAMVVRMALSGVARTRERAGLQAVAEMLIGHGSERLERMGLASLSTFGLLRDRSKEWTLALLRRLISATLVDVTPTEYPVPYLTPMGRAVMTGATPVNVLLPQDDAGRSRSKTRAARVEVDMTGVDPALFERLRTARLEIARARGLPAYVIAHDRTLREMAARRPTTSSELALVPGMGPARIDAYGERFLAVLREP